MHTSPWTVEDRLAHLERRVAVLERMGRLSRLITSTLDLHRLLSIITEAASELTNTEAASIALVQPETGELYFETASGPAKDTVKRYTIPLEGSVAGWVFTHNQPVMIRDAQNDPRHFPVIDKQTGFQTRSLLEAPLNVRGETIGVIMAVNYQQEGDFMDEDLQTLTALASHAAIAIENARLFEAQKDAVSALETANLRLEEMDRLKSSFIGVITHELRTPVANLDFALQILERYGTENWTEEQRQQVQQIKDGIAASQRMIDNLVSFATYFGQRRELLLDRADMGDTVSQVVDRMRQVATAKEVDIFLEIERPLPPVCGDHDQLGEAVQHLVDNAIKFTAAGGAVLIRCWSADECVHLEVRDTGIGVPSDRLPGLWEGFAQMADPLQRGVEGLGLGLALVRYVVSAHGGQVCAESKEGVGSMFGFRVPIDGPTVPHESVHQAG